MSRCTIARVPVARVCHSRRHAVVVVARVIVSIAVEGPPAHKILQVNRRATNALLIEGSYFRLRKSDVIKLFI